MKFFSGNVNLRTIEVYKVTTIELQLIKLKTLISTV